MSVSSQPVLILGAGINGAAIARELALNGVPVCLLDTADMAYGATAHASRLIHGGLRYLEYGEFDLVRESLAERTRLLRLAPQYVVPLKLSIPVENRFGGLWTSAERFLFKGGRGQANRPARPRGLWLVRFGLRLYDTYARDPDLPSHSTHTAGAADAIEVNHRYRWLCNYYDAQIRFPERFVVALIEDGRQAAALSGSGFDVLTYHRATLEGHTANIFAQGESQPVRSFAPAAVINATGAWVDMTLARLKMPSDRLMGGTKGSHILTWNERLRSALAGKTGAYAGLYAEAADGRPVFVLPFGDATLIGTTDEAYEGDPANAVATPAEIDYLLATTNELLPSAKLTTADVDLCYCGVRPLPYVGAATPASVTRRHWLAENKSAPMPFYSVIGGKLTTCRSLAEETTAMLLARLGIPVRETSESRPIPGAAGFPTAAAEQAECLRLLTERLGCELDQVQAVWQLYGTRAEAVLSDFPAESTSVVGTSVPRGVVRYAIRNEWVRSLDDLVERRLMLLYHRHLFMATLEELARMLADEGVIEAGEIPEQIERCARRLSERFGRKLAAAAP